LVIDTNPAHPGEVVAEMYLADKSLANEAVEAAVDAFPRWRATPAPARGEILRKAADLLQARTETIAREFAREEGKTLAEAAGETNRAVSILRYYAAQTLDPDGETYASHSENTFLYARREPVGVVLAITPWNFPMAIPAWKIAPTLAYGNVVVWKPPEVVPLTSVRFVEALVDAGLPPGVLNLLLARSSDIGDALVRHESLEAITFTGSERVGRAIQMKATEKGKKVQLELGGKNPAVVLADADLAHAAGQVARGAFLSAGQKCTATSRVIVESDVLAEFNERLVVLASNWKVGDPLDPATQIGPLVSKERLEMVMDYLESGSQEGGRFLHGGGRDWVPGDGYYLRPTVLTDVEPSSRVATEEIFGPVVVVLPASTYDEALRLANQTRFGLSAALFTRDLGKALRFANDIQAGVVKINQETAGLEFQAPFGGMKASSSGSREQGKVAREFFTQWKTVYMDHPPGGKQ
jgi:aldehyde dehydrogenase (NAD+)